MNYHVYQIAIVLIHFTIYTRRPFDNSIIINRTKKIPHTKPPLKNPGMLIYISSYLYCSAAHPNSSYGQIISASLSARHTSADSILQNP
jgi:hypothetical protein